MYIAPVPYYSIDRTFPQTPLNVSFKPSRFDFNHQFVNDVSSARASFGHPCGPAVLGSAFDVACRVPTVAVDGVGISVLGLGHQLIFGPNSGVWIIDALLRNSIS